MNDVCQLGRSLLTASHLSSWPFQRIHTYKFDTTMIDRRDTPDYWEAKKEIRRKDKSGDEKMNEKELTPIENFIRELTQEKVTVVGLSSTEKKGRIIIDDNSLKIGLSMMTAEEVGHNSEQSILNSLQVKNDCGSYLIPTAHRSLLGVNCTRECTTECARECTMECIMENSIMHVSAKVLISFSELVNAQWYNEKDEKELYYQTLIPMPMDGIKRFCIRDYIQIIPPDNGDIYLDIPLSREKQVRVFSKEIHQVRYLVIESRFPCTYNEILNYTYAVSLSLGLMTTIAPFDYAFVIASEIPDFGGKIMGGMIKLRPTIKSQYRFITTDISELYEDLKEKVDYDAFRPYCDKEGNLLRSHLDPMTEQDFSGLVSMLHRSKDLARATMMLLVASDDIEYLGPLYSVVLETICWVLEQENEELFKSYSKNPKKGYLPNGEKLSMPFNLLEQIGYELSDSDMAIIKTRNNFLHGSTPEYELDSDKDKKIVNTQSSLLGDIQKGESDTDKLRYICMELRKFCGILLLRYSGYKGAILNNVVEMGLKKTLPKEQKKEQKKEQELLFITYDEEEAKKIVEKWKNEKQKEEEKKKKQSQGKNNTRNQGNEKAPQPTEKPEASV